MMVVIVGGMLYKKKSRPGELICKNKNCGYVKEEPMPEAPLSPLDMPPPPGDDDIPF